VTIYERIRGDRRPVEFGRIAKDLMNRDISALGRDAADVYDQVKDIREVAADAIENLQAFAAGAAERASEAVEHLGDEAAKATQSLVKDLPRSPKDVQLDGIRLDKGVDDLVVKLKKALPTERITNLVENLERELPTTDKGRYDRAYSRGWARARTSYIVVGTALGIAGGIAGAYLFDPKQGKGRRDRLTAKVRGATRDVAGQVRRTATYSTDRARGLAIERGLLPKPGSKGGADDGAPVLQATPVAPLVGVMDPVATGADANTAPEALAVEAEITPVMPVGDSPVTDPSSIVLEPLPEAAGTAAAASDASGLAEGDERLSANANAATSTLEPEAENATLTGEDEDRGTWHRTL
jgi:gas vesicle protein